MWNTKALAPPPPHLHIQGHIVCAYQYDTLEGIAQKIKSGAFGVGTVKNYQARMHMEDVLDAEVYTDFLPKVEKEWRARFAGPEHDAMSVTPAYLHEDAVAIGATNISTARDGREREALMRDGEVFRREYMRAAQYIFSRVHHHVHEKTKTGYMPLKACLRKGKRQPKACKAGFQWTARVCATQSLFVEA